MYSNLRGFQGDCKYCKRNKKKTKTKMHIKILTPQGREDQYQRGCLVGGGQE